MLTCFRNFPRGNKIGFPRFLLPSACSFSLQTHSWTLKAVGRFSLALRQGELLDLRFAHTSKMCNENNLTQSSTPSGWLLLFILLLLFFHSLFYYFFINWFATHQRTFFEHTTNHAHTATSQCSPEHYPTPIKTLRQTSINTAQGSGYLCYTGFISRVDFLLVLSLRLPS